LRGVQREGEVVDLVAQSMIDLSAELASVGERDAVSSFDNIKPNGDDRRPAEFPCSCFQLSAGTPISPT
jgi:hypothetical protein